MEFFSNVLDSIPVVGHVKGIVHYIVQDIEGGNKAMYQSTRTSAVLAGGAVGCFLGPGGAAVGAICGGMVTDGMATVVFNEPQGLVQSCINIGEDLSAGKNPTGSILSTGIQVGLDGVGGLGMSGAASKVSKKVVTNTIENMGKKVATKVGENIFEKPLISATEAATIIIRATLRQAVEHPDRVLVSAHITLTASKRQDDEKIAKGRKWEKERNQRQAKRKKEEQNNKGQQSSGSSQPPNNDRTNTAKEESEPYYLVIFMKLLKKLLTLIYGAEREPVSKIFRDLTEGDIEYLEKIISRLYKFGTLDGVVELVIRIFKEHFPNDISLANFLSLLEFVQAYINEEVTVRNMNSRGKENTLPKKKHKTLLKESISIIMGQKNIVQLLINLFKKLKDEIRVETSAPNNIISPYFRDIFSAVAHYCKHKHIPGDGTLTVKQYFDFIRKFLPTLKGTPEYGLNFCSLKKPKDSSVSIVCDVYVAKFSRRFRIVVKRHGGTIVLSSGFVVARKYPNDKEGDVFIEVKITQNRNKRKPQKE